MTAPHIVVATPCFGGTVTHSFLMSMLRFTRAADKAGLPLEVLTLGGDSLISRARSVLLSYFLAKSAATHLLFIDADIGFEPEQVFRLIAADRDFVAALYPLKRVDWAKLPIHALAGEPLPLAGLSYVGQLAAPHRIEGSFAQANYAGTGFQLIKRCVFERLIAVHPELKFRSVHSGGEQQAPSDHLYALFECLIEPETGAYLSEDYSFCRRWRAIGGEIWLDLESKLTHTGPHEFHGDSTQRFETLRVEAAGLGRAA